MRRAPARRLAACSFAHRFLGAATRAWPVKRGLCSPPAGAGGAEGGLRAASTRGAVGRSAKRLQLGCRRAFGFWSCVRGAGKLPLRILCLRKGRCVPWLPRSKLPGSPAPCLTAADSLPLNRRVIFNLEELQPKIRVLSPPRRRAGGRMWGRHCGGPGMRLRAPAGLFQGLAPLRLPAGPRALAEQRPRGWRLLPRSARPAFRPALPQTRTADTNNPCCSRRRGGSLLRACGFPWGRAPPGSIPGTLGQLSVPHVGGRAARRRPLLGRPASPS